MATTTQTEIETTELSNSEQANPPTSSSPAHHVYRPDGTWQPHRSGQTPIVNPPTNSNAPRNNQSITRLSTEVDRVSNASLQTIGNTPGNRGLGAPNENRSMSTS